MGPEVRKGGCYRLIVSVVVLDGLVVTVLASKPRPGVKSRSRIEFFSFNSEIGISILKSFFISILIERLKAILA